MGKRDLTGDSLDWRVRVHGRKLTLVRWGLTPLYRSRRYWGYHPDSYVFQRVAVDVSNSRGLPRRVASFVVFVRYQMRKAVVH